MASCIRKILITAGPTREMLDPVRFISNLSTGEMGYALARAAVRRKYQVTLVSGPTALKPPAGVHMVPVITGREMKRVCEELFPRHDCLIMAAAVCDFKPAVTGKHKIQSGGGYALRLKRTPDILASLAKRKGKKLVIGFCLETKDLLKRAREKVVKKNLDGIVANFYEPQRHIPFGDRASEVVLIGKDLKPYPCPRQAKTKTAGRILDWMKKLAMRQDKILFRKKGK